MGKSRQCGEEVVTAVILVRGKKSHHSMYPPLSKVPRHLGSVSLSYHPSLFSGQADPMATQVRCLCPCGTPHSRRLLTQCSLFGDLRSHLILIGLVQGALSKTKPYLPTIANRRVVRMGL